jgi:peptidoglycan/LPS O-acetylase OafA/YrhL
LHQIDALRGLAALLVIVAHASSSFASYARASGHSDLLYTLSQCIDTGRIGVMVFFIVSGVVVANTPHTPYAALRWAVAYPTALLIFSVLYFVNGRWLRVASRLGLISYSMYLLHPAAITLVGWLIENNLFRCEIAYLPVMAFAVIGLAIALSSLTYAWIEKPFISLSRKLTVRSALPATTAQSNSSPF